MNQTTFSHHSSQPQRPVVRGLATSGLAITLLLGCSSPAPHQPEQVELSTSIEKTWVDNPEFLHWNQFPIGSQVVKKKVISNGNGTVEVTTTMTVREKTADKVIVDQQVTVVHPDSTLENPSQSLEYVSKFQLPAGMSLEAFSLPSLKARQAGTAEIELLGKVYVADVFEWEEKNERGPMSVKLWRSDKVPGRTIKEEATILDGNDTSREMVMEISIAG